MVVFTAVVLAFQLSDTRARVREDTDSASKVAAQMLTYFVDTYADASEPVVRQSLQRLGHVRSTDMTLHDAHGRVIYRSPPSPYKVGLNAPGWYSALVAPAPLHYQLRLAGSVLDIQSNSSRAVLDGWDDTVYLLQLGLIVMVVGNLLVFWLVGRTIRPLRDIVRGLEDMQGGLSLARLPEFKNREARAIAQARRIEIELGSDAHALHIDVRDDGRGLAPDWELAGHYGIRGMRERARTLGGDVEIENNEAGGVRTHARLPLE